MYLEHFQLKEKPFLLNTDPRFLWLGHKHKEALAILKYGVQENKGLLLLTGEIGSDPAPFLWAGPAVTVAIIWQHLIASSKAAPSHRK